MALHVLTLSVPTWRSSGRASGNPRPKAGFLLARIRGDAHFVSFRQQRPKETARVDVAICTGGGGSCHRPLAPIGRCARSAWGRLENPVAAPPLFPWLAVR